MRVMQKIWTHHPAKARRAKFVTHVTLVTFLFTLGGEEESTKLLAPVPTNFSEKRHKNHKRHQKVYGANVRWVKIINPQYVASLQHAGYAWKADKLCRNYSSCFPRGRKEP